jgi:hypothetical protein
LREPALLEEAGERGKIKSTAASSWWRVSMGARVIEKTERTRGGAKAMTAKDVTRMKPILARSFKSLDVRRSVVHHAAMTATGTRERTAA